MWSIHGKEICAYTWGAPNSEKNAYWWWSCEPHSWLQATRRFFCRWIAAFKAITAFCRWMCSKIADARNQNSAGESMHLILLRATTTYASNESMQYAVHASTVLSLQEVYLYCFFPRDVVSISVLLMLNQRMRLITRQYGYCIMLVWIYLCYTRHKIVKTCYAFIKYNYLHSLVHDVIRSLYVPL